MKVCDTCRVTKPYSDFQKNRTHADGYRIHCRACINVKRRELHARMTAREYPKPLQPQDRRALTDKRTNDGRPEVRPS